MSETKNYENAREMDAELKSEIIQFHIKVYGMGWYQAADLVQQLETHLRDKGFDLGCICQYNKP